MNASLYVQSLQNILLSSLQRDHPGGHRFMQDNDPKHTSSAAQAFLKAIESTGGKHHLKARMLTPLKTCGMS